MRETIFNLTRKGRGIYLFGPVIRGAVLPRPNPARKPRDLSAVLAELARFANKEVKITSSQMAVPWFARHMNAENETAMVLLLDGAGFPIRVIDVTKGTVNASFIAAGVVYREAIRENATSIILGHNHPSGHLEMSEADRNATKKMYLAGKILSIPLLDHLIVGKTGFNSLRESAPGAFIGGEY